MISHAKLLSISALAFLAPTLVFSQITLPDTLFVKATVENAKQIYHQSTKSYSRLYNGKEYIEFKKNMPEIGTPFFRSEDWEEGQVFYDGELYEKVFMRYDLLQEKLVVEHKGHGEIELISEKIKYFRIAGHTFVRLEEKIGNKSPISPGFYDLIYDGNTKVYVKRLKITEEKVETQLSIILTFKEKNSVIISKKGAYSLVGNKSSDLKVFGDQKSALKKFISKNKIRYRANREEALVKIAGHYDQLTN